MWQISGRITIKNSDLHKIKAIKCATFLTWLWPKTKCSFCSWSVCDDVSTDFVHIFPTKCLPHMGIDYRHFTKTIVHICRCDFVHNLLELNWSQSKLPAQNPNESTSEWYGSSMCDVVWLCLFVFLMSAVLRIYATQASTKSESLPY